MTTHTLYDGPAGAGHLAITAPPAPEPGEVGELVAYLQDHGTWLIQSGYANASIEARDLGIRVFRAATLLRQLSAPAPAVPEAGEVGEFELTPREVEAQEAFTQLRDEVLNLSEGAELNKVLRIIDNHTPEWV